MSEKLTADEIRSNFIDGLHYATAYFFNHPEVPTPFNVHISHFTTEAEARKIRAGSYGWSKEDAGEYFKYVRYFTPDNQPGYHVVAYEIFVAKAESSTCRRVQTGTRHVEAQPERDDPLYEWRCGPELATDLPDNTFNAE
jgi:hypothetical protein